MKNGKRTAKIVSGFITGAAAVFAAWFGLPSIFGMLLFYVLSASVVYIGMKLVGVCENIVNEQIRRGEKISWIAVTLPCLLIALAGGQSFVGFTRMASVVQVLTGVGVIIAYNRSRKRVGTSTICGKFGSLPFQILAAAASLVASIGAVLTVTV